MNSRSLSRRAFTLIELLIVITIIGILAVALIPRLTGGPARARDAQRQADLQQIATALEFLYNDKGGYPFYAGCVSSMATDLASYLTTLPADPNTSATAGTASGEFSSGSCSTGYAYVGLRSSGSAAGTYSSATYNATGYMLVADLETETSRGSGIYNVTSSAFTVTNGTANATAAYNFNTANSSLSCSTSACTGTNVIYVLGR